MFIAVVQLNTNVLVDGAADTSHYLSSNSSELLLDVLFPSSDVEKRSCSFEPG